MLKNTKERARRRRVDERGVTLIELMVTVGLVGIVLASVMAAFLSQNKLYKEMSDRREAQSSARQAMSVIARHLSNAGYGMGPEFAFDFDFYDCGGNCAVRNNRDRGPRITDPSGAIAYTVNDKSDELVFMARNPAYFAKADPSLPTTGNVWNIDGTNAPGREVTLRLHRDDVIYQGQVLLLVCPGAFTYTYVTVAATATTPGGLLKAIDTAPVNVSLTNHVAGDPYQQTDEIDEACFTSGRARAFAIDRYRFFVMWDASDPVEVANDPNGWGRPYLYLDRGLDLNGDGVIDDRDAIPVAPDVENIQVAYVMADGQTRPDAYKGVAVPTDQPLANPCSSEVRIPFYRERNLVACPTTAAQRRTMAIPGNIRAVRVTLVTRSRRPKRERSGAASTANTNDARRAIEDYLPSGGVDGFQRQILTRTIEVPHLLSRGIPLI